MSGQMDPDAYRAMLDQATANLRELAPAIATFWKALIEAGMSESAATEVTAVWVGAQSRGKA